MEQRTICINTLKGHLSKRTVTGLPSQVNTSAPQCAKPGCKSATSAFSLLYQTLLPPGVSLRLADCRQQDPEHPAAAERGWIDTNIHPEARKPKYCLKENGWKFLAASSLSNRKVPILGSQHHLGLMRWHPCRGEGTLTRGISANINSTFGYKPSPSSTQQLQHVSAHDPEHSIGSGLSSLAFRDLLKNTVLPHVTLLLLKSAEEPEPVFH